MACPKEVILDQKTKKRKRRKGREKAHLQDWVQRLHSEVELERQEQVEEEGEEEEEEAEEADEEVEQRHLEPEEEEVAKGDDRANTTEEMLR